MSKDIMVTRASMPSLEEYTEEIKDIWDSHWMTNMGEKHKELQKQLCSFLNVENVELFTNGHMALEMALQAFNLTGEVITTPFTFASTTHAIVRNGLTPVFCDVDSNNYTIDVSKIEELITPRTTAIVPVHVYGNICDVEEIDRIAKKHGLKVIYDAAHAFGERYKGIDIGNFGDASCFSFHATKVFNTIEGGAVCFKDKEFGLGLYRLKNFGIRGPEIVDGIGANAKMNEFCAAMGICNLRYIRENIKKRQKLTNLYNMRLKEACGIRLNNVMEEVESNYSYYPIYIEEEQFGMNRDELQEKLAKSNIFTRKYFYPITSAFDCYKDVYDSQKTPVALKLSKKVLTLPLYPDLEENDVKKICEIILN